MHSRGGHDSGALALQAGSYAERYFRSLRKEHCENLAFASSLEPPKSTFIWIASRYIGFTGKNGQLCLKGIALRYNRTTSFHLSINQPHERNLMRTPSTLRWQVSERIVSLLVLGILVLYTYGILGVAPYAGFYFENSNGRIADVYSTSTQTPTLQVGDILVKVGDISWEEYKKNAWLVFFAGLHAGDVVEIEVNRNGEPVTVMWKYPGLDPSVLKSRFINIWPLSFIFWICGAAAQIVARPRDTRRRLFIAANYLTALWLIFGSLSTFRLWGSSILLHATTWILLPVYLHFHWVFPHPLKEIPKTAWAAAYLTGFALAIAEVAQILPKSLYAIGFLTALLGSLLFAIMQYVRHKDKRQDILILAGGILIAFIPVVILAVLVIRGSAPALGPIMLVSLPFMPLTYFYVIARRQLGGLEIRLNHLIAYYAFLLLLGTILFGLTIPFANLVLRQEMIILTGIPILLFVAFAAIYLYPRFQVFFDRRFLGIKLPHQNLLETYSNRITTSTSLHSLLQFLEDEVFPSLLIRQYAFMQVRDEKLKALLAKKVSDDQLPNDMELGDLIAQTKELSASPSVTTDWVRLILPLKVGDNYLGFWLLGQRDPDDLYPYAEIPILQSIANQTAIALSNILHAEQLRKMYQVDIERNEQERMRLALELHDSILNQLGYLRRNFDEDNLSPKLQSAYEELTRRLREIVSNLRPPMLTYGLKPAIEDLADTLMERTKDKINIHVELQSDEERIPGHMELHLFRIVQEACENIVQHADATKVNIRGKLTPQELDLYIDDNGKGFDFDGHSDLNTLLDNNHFGLAGMIERARLIGADIQVHSNPGQGTKVHVTWYSES